MFQFISLLTRLLGLLDVTSWWSNRKHLRDARPYIDFTDKEKRRYKFVTAGGMLLWLFFIGLNGYFFIKLFKYLFEQINHVVYQDNLLMIAGGTSIMEVAGAYAGVLLSLLIVIVLFKMSMGQKWKSYEVFLDQHFGRSYFIESVKRMVRVWLLPMLVIFVLGMDWSVNLTSTQIRINPFWGFTDKKYAYDQVDRLYTFPYEKGDYPDEHFETHFLVQFRDGYYWESQNAFGADTNTVKRAMEIISARSGKAAIAVTPRFIYDSVYIRHNDR